MGKRAFIVAVVECTGAHLSSNCTNTRDKPAKCALYILQTTMGAMGSLRTSRKQNDVRLRAPIRSDHVANRTLS